MMKNKNKTIVIGITGGIAGYKIAGLIKLLKKDHHYREIVERREVDHIKLAGRADLLVIAPATANTISKLAAGLADNLLTTLSLAVTCPVVLCPSMNIYMWENP